MWTKLTLDSADETRNKAFVGPVDDTPWALRRAKSGCWELRGNFELIRTRGTWKIKRLPRVHRRCSPRMIRATWRGGTARGVIEWPGTYQRIDPTGAAYSHTARLIGHPNYESRWSVRRSFDVPAPDSFQEHLPYDGRLATAWGVTSPVRYSPVDPTERSWGTLTYHFPDEVQLLRIRVHNGVRAGKQYEDHGRIKKAIIRAGTRTVERCC